MAGGGAGRRPNLSLPPDLKKFQTNKQKKVLRDGGSRRRALYPPLIRWPDWSPTAIWKRPTVIRVSRGAGRGFSLVSMKKMKGEGNAGSPLTGGFPLIASGWRLGDDGGPPVRSFSDGRRPDFEAEEAPVRPSFPPPNREEEPLNGFRVTTRNPNPIW